MKKFIATLVTGFGYLSTAVSVFALQVTAPSDQGIAGSTAPGIIITSVLRIVYAVGAVMVLFMLIFGAFQWITSGGDKEAVQKARSRITNALIGLAILALSLVIITIIAAILKIDITKNFIINDLEGKPTTL